MRGIPYVETVTCRVSEIEAHSSSIQLFTPNVIEAAERYRFDEELKNDPVEYQRVYEELKIEAALLVIVRTVSPLLRGLGPDPDRNFVRTPPTLRSAPSSITTMTRHCQRTPSVFG